MRLLSSFTVLIVTHGVGMVVMIGKLFFGKGMFLFSYLAD
jgi:hypothetical protein